MARRREVHLKGNFITFDRANSFQLSTSLPRHSKNGNLATSDQDPSSGVEHPSSRVYSDSETSSSLWSESQESIEKPLGETVEKQIVSKHLKTPKPSKKARTLGFKSMQRSVSLGNLSRDHGDALESRLKKRLPITLSGRSLKTFINAAIDPHVMKVMADGTVMISDATLAGAEFGPIANSLTGSKEFVLGEAEVLAILLKHNTQRIKKLLVPSKRKRSYPGQKIVSKNFTGVTGIKTQTPGDPPRVERSVGTTALMGYVAQPIQKKPLAVETKLVAPRVGLVPKSERKWYQL